MLVSQCYTKIKTQTCKIWKSFCEPRDHNNAQHSVRIRDGQNQGTGSTKGNVILFVLFLNQHNIILQIQVTAVLYSAPKLCKQKFWVTRCLKYTGHIYITVRPLLSGHLRDFVNWPLNRGWPFNRGIEYCSLETLK